ncbi:MAG: hypothetical protein US51_C0041G0012 [Microgenomates group bacterium GW2011_GWA2_37_6]|nr:MAG: hypothetical protein US51_C0041G0012 [Microgenomates group bacterium GW2011_GWA2_37_6]
MKSKMIKILKFKKKKIKKKISFNNFLKILLIFLFSLSTFLLGILYEKIVSSSRSSEEFEVSQKVGSKELASIQNKVIKENYVFKIKWGDLGKRMVEDGVIDKTKLAQAVSGSDNLPKDLDKYFSDEQNKIEVNQKNAQFWVDVLWGLGLANKNKILEEGSMTADGDASNFASTGGWTLGIGEPMSHYSGHSYIILSDKEQKIVEEIAGNIYRPCCDNPTLFPDCNHGMAALGLIELMVSQGISIDEIYKTVLAFNTYWFPETYLNTAYYFKSINRDYSKATPKEILSKTYSSGTGAGNIQREVGAIQWFDSGSGGSCGA